MSRGTGEKDVGLCNYLKEYGTPLPPRCAPFDQPKTLNGHSTRTSKAVQMTQNWVNVLILKIEIKHIGFNVGL